ncbi:MAG: 50S ribosomal protein L11 methyltransferase [Ignavibacteriaceae bacterium]|nr:50S ribosomal protein L11 methyltransferase [Ignavibacteriaceae bacterium]
MKRFNKFIVSSEPFIPDLLESVLWELDIKGITEEENQLVVYSDENINSLYNSVKTLLEELKKNGIIRNFEITEELVEDKNWNEEWEKTITPIQVTDKIIITQTFHQYDPKPGQLILTIDPKMSFGTGEHQTTKLMLSMIEKYITGGERVLDVGSGSGVLAIASVKLGGSSAIAVDHDEWCLENAAENCKLNNVEKQVEVKLGEISSIKENNFDTILANIQKNVLMEIASEIATRVIENGVVILSGLLKEDENDIIDEYSKYGFSLLEKGEMDEWIVLVIKKGLS